jgi:hypothetical protein
MLVLPLSSLKLVAAAHAAVPEIMDLSLPAILLHLGLSACIWALLVIIYKLSNRPRPRVVRALGQRGSVMAETLIVLPIFFLMSMGLAQLAINNVAGILANVAVYQSARTAWVWQPEKNIARVNATVTQANITDRARIAAALVMTPAAPGNYFSSPFYGTQAFKATRFSMAASQVPGGGALGGIGGLLTTVGSIDPTIATRNNLSLSRALDHSSFLRRGMQKFTHAYAATTVRVIQPSGRIGVELTYKLHQVMPFARRLFGTFDSVHMRMGYFVTYTRQYTFKAQPYMPNAALPDNGFGGGAASRSGSLSDYWSW